MSESLFTSQIPTNLDVTDGGQRITIGTLMKFSMPGKVLGIRWYPPANPSGVAPIAAFYRFDSDSAGTLLAQKTFGAIAYGAGWTTLLFDTPVDVLADPQWYVPCVYADRYTSTPHLFDTALTNGNITASANGSGHQNGRFIEPSGSSPTYPNSSFNGSAYFVDVLFQAATAKPGIWGINR